MAGYAFLTGMYGTCSRISAGYVLPDYWSAGTDPDLADHEDFMEKKHQPDIFQNTAHFLLLKDYIIYRLCDNLVGDHSIYCFSHYFDITKKGYWTEILDYCGVCTYQLPTLMPSGSIAGCLIPELTDAEHGLTADTKINIGTLDHFAGMIGTGSIKEGQVSESAGTVLSIAALTPAPVFDGRKLPNYCGPFKDSYVLLPVCESGGFSMEWFKKQFLEEVFYSELNEILASKVDTHPPIFLPYLTGVNPPEFDENASGVFFGLHANHDKYDMALAIMQGVACMLGKNLDYIKQSGIQIEIPDNEEAPCLGAAIMAAVDEQMYASYDEAIASCVSTRCSYLPSEDPRFEQTYQLFCHVYDALGESFRMNNLTRQIMVKVWHTLPDPHNRPSNQPLINFGKPSTSLIIRFSMYYNFKV